MKTTCPYCGRREMTLQIEAEYATRLSGVEVRIGNARISRCGACGGTMVAADELKRWREVQRRQLQEQGHIPSAEQVRQLRRALGLSVADLAVLLGVTRQSVNAWEQPDGPPISLGPGALLIQLLRGELEGKCSGVLQGLVEAAAARGQAVRIQAAGAK